MSKNDPGALSVKTGDARQQVARALAAHNEAQAAYEQARHSTTQARARLQSIDRELLEVDEAARVRLLDEQRDLILELSFSPMTLGDLARRATLAHLALLAAQARAADDTVLRCDQEWRALSSVQQQGATSRTPHNHDSATMVAVASGLRATPSKKSNQLRQAAQPVEQLRSAALFTGHAARSCAQQLYRARLFAGDTQPGGSSKALYGTWQAAADARASAVIDQATGDPIPRDGVEMNEPENDVDQRMTTAMDELNPARLTVDDRDELLALVVTPELTTAQRARLDALMEQARTIPIDQPATPAESRPTVLHFLARLGHRKRPR